MSSVPLRVLITGFGPFPGVCENASASFARLLTQQTKQSLPEVRAITAVLPTEWETAPGLLSDLVAETQPAVCLHFGVSCHVRGVTLETCARNAAGRKLDAAGRYPVSPRLRQDAPSVLLPTANPMRLLGHQACGRLPLTQSLASGDYVCNAVYFHSLWLARQQRMSRDPGRQVAFLHLPVRFGGLGWADNNTLEDKALSLDLALRTAMLVLHTLCELAAPPTVTRVAFIDPVG
jgi:pyroglutamyl-peptidase